ncbi:MAG: glycine betaine ABC transporter substrate-binding protein, partial [Rhodobiaceae bacterium]
MKMFIRKGFIRKGSIRKGMAITASLFLAGMATSAQAADSVNVAFFLEWATPNQIAKVDKAYDEAMGVDVNWTNFLTGVQMTEAMLAGDIDIAYSQGLAPFVTVVQQGAPLILTIFGIQDDGKIFLLFMVAFAIMVISARTGASGTQLSKIRASHSLGATNGQILRHVI